MADPINEKNAWLGTSNACMAQPKSKILNYRPPLLPQLRTMQNNPSVSYNQYQKKTTTTGFILATRKAYFQYTATVLDVEGQK